VADEIAIGVAVAVRIVVVAVPIAAAVLPVHDSNAAPAARAVHATTAVIAIPVRRAARN